MKEKRITRNVFRPFRGASEGVMSHILRLLAGDRTTQAAVPLFFVVMTLISASILLLVLGKNPLAAFAAFLQGSGFMPRPSYAGGQNMFTDFLSFLGILAPMILAALAMVVSLKAGMLT